MRKIHYKGLAKLIRIVTDMHAINLPMLPHLATELLHTRARNAILELAEELRICNISAKTDPCFSYGNTELDSPICRVIITPGPIYNRVSVISKDQIQDKHEDDYFEVNFNEFLKDPMQLVDAIQTLINIKYIKYMSGRGLL